MVGSPPLIRASGSLHQLIDKVITPVIVAELIQTIASKSIFNIVDSKGEVNFATSFPGVARFRINIYKQRGSYTLVAHYITTRIPVFDDFDIPEGIRNFADIKKGLVIIAGEGGAGRSTTVASIINHRRCNFSSKIITLEDPIEFVYKHAKSIVCQREFGTDFFDWDSALHNTLRQSPDMVSIGEIDTYTKLQMALRICASGRLCVATVVATNSARVFGVMENLTPEVERQHLRQQLSRAVAGISCQKLATSTSGQSLAAFEILSSSPFLVSLIGEGDYKGVREFLSKEADGSMQTIDDHLIVLVQSGMIARDEAVSRAEVPEELKVRLRSMEKTDTSVNPDEAGLSLARDGDAMRDNDEAFL